MKAHPVTLPVVVLFLALLGVGATSKVALLSTLIDGISALLIVMPFALGGLWLVPLFGLGQMPRRWHFLLGAALGIGAASLLILMLGLGGVLHRTLFVALMVLSAAGGWIRLRDLSARSSSQTQAEETPTGGKWRYLWLLTAPFLSLAFMAAASAPGFIWQEEGFGYDVLEYHLQLPKEYHDAGAIRYAPHNVYGNFPANVEMLYLLSMIIYDGDVDTALIANYIHLLLAALTVFAAWVIGRDMSPTCGHVSAVLLATTGWLGYLSGMAYVENGLLFFGLTAMGALLRSCRGDDADETQRTTPLNHSTPRNRSTCLRWIAIAGALAGFSCGCKYTAVVMIAFPLAVAAAFLVRASSRLKWQAVAVFSAATLITFSPWLVKNVVMTGNPVFPLLGDVFEHEPDGWDRSSQERWVNGHQPAPEEQTLPSKLSAAWRHIPGDPLQRFGPAIFLLAVGGVWASHRRRARNALMFVLILQFLVWLLATHLYARFAVVLLVPLTLLSAIAMNEPSNRRRIVATIVLLIGTVWNFGFAAARHSRESAVGASPHWIYDGQTEQYAYLDVVNHDLPPDAKLLLIGDAKAFYYQVSVDYSVVFNRNPLAEAVRAATSDREIIQWLIRKGYTHVLVHWSEMARLRKSRYGFPEELDANLFHRLANEGLSVMREFPLRNTRYITLYKVEH